MKVLYKNKTKYTKEIYSKFLEFHQNKYGKSYYLYTIVLIILLIFCIIVQSQSKNYLLAILTCAILIGFFVWRSFHPIRTIEKELKSKKIQKEQEFIFKFYDKYFKVYSQKIDNKIYYWQLKKVFETSHFFYLYIDKTHAFLISKQGFDIGTSEQFTKFIHKKCIFKFHESKEDKI